MSDGARVRLPHTPRLGQAETAIRKRAETRRVVRKPVLATFMGVPEQGDFGPSRRSSRRGLRAKARDEALSDGARVRFPHTPRLGQAKAAIRKRAETRRAAQEPVLTTLMHAAARDSRWLRLHVRIKQSLCI